MLLRPAVVALTSILAFAVPPLPAMAEAPAPQSAATVADLSRTMRIGDLITVLRDEGLSYGASLETELFPGAGGDSWRVALDLIYDTPTMQRRFDEALALELGGDPATLAAANGFFADARGQRILGLEIEARRALLDEAVEEAAKSRVEDMAAADDPRLELLRRFAEANDLIESNVQGALNANLAFFRGMVELGSIGDGVSEDQMLSDVWGQEGQVREETVDWLYPYLALAYGPLDDADLEAYVTFSETPEGKKLNAALFAAFDAVFTTISRDLGRAAGRQMIGQDI